MTTLTTAIRRFLFLLVITFLGGGAVLAYDLPGIPDSGAPAFYNDVDVFYGPKNNVLSIKQRGGGWSFDNGTQIFAGTDAKFTLRAYFDDDGLTRGWVRVRGTLLDFGIKDHRVMSADLTSMNLDDDPLLWGFSTVNIVCSDKLLITCTERESVYVALDDSFDVNALRGAFRTAGLAITTVPVPAAAWLFGSALGLLGWMRRKSA